MGHLHRAVALTRCIVGRMESQVPEEIATRKKNQVCLLTNSPYADSLPLPKEIGMDQTVITMPTGLNRDDTVARVVESLQKFACDVLIVDTFPRGLGGELPDLLQTMKCRKVLVHRDLNPRYVDEVNLSQDLDFYDQLLVPGEPAPFQAHPRAQWTSPWLIRDDSELLDPAESRKTLGVTSDTIPVIAVLGCGKPAELAQMHTVATRLNKEFKFKAAVRFVSPRVGHSATVNCDEELVAVQLWPFLKSLRGVSLVVGGGGYNTVYETRCTRTPLIGFAQPRLYDRQSERLRPDQIATSYEDVRKLVAQIVARSPSTPTGIPRYSNGVHQAVDMIESLF